MSQDPATTFDSQGIKHHLRFDQRSVGGDQAWIALSQTPGVGVSITDAKGKLLFVNETSCVLFSGRADIDYSNKSISDFHCPQFVEERLALIARVLDERKPLRIKHIYLGRAIDSTVFPFRDHTAPFHRALVITRNAVTGDLEDLVPTKIETVETKYIELGPLDVLTKRELEVLVLLGHGMSVPRAAAILHRSPKTIERHKSAIGHKLSLQGQSELVYIVTTMGLDIRDVQLQRLPESKA